MQAKSRPAILLKRAYDPAAHADGCRLLVDRVWPRGLTRDALALEGWVKDVAPSASLRKWFAHDPSKWSEFRERYLDELADRSEAIASLLERCHGRTLTLVFGAKDIEHNNAVVLKEYLEQRFER